MKKVLKNIISSALPQMMNIITNLILPTLIISNFGSEINGLISSIKVTISYVSIVGAGIATAVTQSLYAPVAMKDIKTVRGMLSAANRMFNKFGIIYCIIALILAFIYPFFLDTSIRYKTIVLLMIVMSVSGASEFFVIGRCRAFLYASQKTYVCMLIQAMSLLGSLLLALLMLKLKMDIVIVQLAISLVYILRAIFLTYYIRKNYPELNGCRKEKPIKAAVAKRKYALIHQVSGLAVSGSQNTILTILVSLQAASIYSVYNVVFSGIQLICSNISTALTPYFGREYALDNREKLLKMYDMVEFAFFSIVTFVYAVAMVMVVPFVEVYMSNADINYIYPTFATIFVISSAFYVLKMPSNSLINVAGHFKETQWRAILEASLVVVIGAICTCVIGLNGVLIGTGMALCWRCIDTVVYTNKHILLQKNYKSFCRLMRAFIIICVSAVIRECSNIIVNSYIDWIKYSVIVSLIVGLVIIVSSILFDKKVLCYFISAIRKKKNIN